MAFDQASLDDFWNRSANNAEPVSSSSEADDLSEGSTDALRANIETNSKIPSDNFVGNFSPHNKDECFRLYQRSKSAYGLFQQKDLPRKLPDSPEKDQSVNSTDEMMCSPPIAGFFIMRKKVVFQASPTRSDCSGSSDDMMFIDQHEGSPLTRTRNSTTLSNNQSPPKLRKPSITNYFQKSSKPLASSSDPENMASRDPKFKDIGSESRTFTFIKAARSKTSNRTTSEKKFHARKPSSPLFKVSPANMKQSNTITSYMKVSPSKAMDIDTSHSCTPPRSNHCNALYDVTSRCNITPSPKRKIPNRTFNKSRLITKHVSGVGSDELSPGTKRILTATEAFGFNGLAMLKKSNVLDNPFL